MKAYKLKGLDPWVEMLNEIYSIKNVRLFLDNKLRECDPSDRRLVALSFACAIWDKNCKIERCPWLTFTPCVLNLLHCKTCILLKNGKCWLKNDQLFHSYTLNSTDKNRQKMQDFLIKLYAEEYEKAVDNDRA